jgi:spore coat protein W
MGNNEFNLEESQKRLLELLVSRTMRKHGFKKGNVDLTEKEKNNLKETVRYLQEQSQKIINQEKNITEHDVNPVTNTIHNKFTDSKDK